MDSPTRRVVDDYLLFDAAYARGATPKVSAPPRRSTFAKRGKTLRRSRPLRIAGPVIHTGIALAAPLGSPSFFGNSCASGWKKSIPVRRLPSSRLSPALGHDRQQEGRKDGPFSVGFLSLKA